MQDWDEPHDKGPPIEEPSRHRSKRKKGKKKFVIESRYIGPQHSWFKSWDTYDGTWHVARKYHTEKQRDMALANLNRKCHNSHAFYKHWEYRSGD